MPLLVLFDSPLFSDEGAIKFGSLVFDECSLFGTPTTPLLDVWSFSFTCVLTSLSSSNSSSRRGSLRLQTLPISHRRSRSNLNANSRTERSRSASLPGAFAFLPRHWNSLHLVDLRGLHLYSLLRSTLRSHYEIPSTSFEE